MFSSDYPSLSALILLVILQSVTGICSGAIDLDATGSTNLTQEARDSDPDCFFGNCSNNPVQPNLSAGIVVSTILGIVVCFGILILVICYFCGCCCFAGRNRKGGEIHAHGLYPPSDSTYSRQEVPMSYLSGLNQSQNQHLRNQQQRFYRNNGPNPVSGAPFHMKTEQQSEC